MKPVNEFQPRTEQDKVEIRRTSPAPIEAVSDSILGSVGVRNHSCLDMLNFGPLARCVLFGAAIIKMDVSPQ